MLGAFDSQRARDGTSAIQPIVLAGEPRMSSIEFNLQLLSVASLAQRCAQETELFFQRRSYDSRYCFELFQRAIRRRSQSAWDVIYTQYHTLVAGWVLRHHTFDSTSEEADYFTNRAFEKMWASITPDRFEQFGDLKSLLRYLQMCVHSVIVDHQRAAEQATLDIEDETLSDELQDRGPNVEDEVLGSLDRDRFWQWLNHRLHDDKERQVLYSCFVLALKPRELFDRQPRTFSDVEEIYRIKQNLVMRLRRDPEIAQFLSQPG